MPRKKECSIKKVTILGDKDKLRDTSTKLLMELLKKYPQLATYDDKG